MFILTHPTASLSSGLEDLAVCRERSSSLEKGIFDVTARIISSTVFPISLTLELFFKRIPKMLMAIGTEKFQDKAKNTHKYMTAIVPSILQGFYVPQKMPKQFLKQNKSLATFPAKKNGTALFKERHSAYTLTGVAIIVIAVAACAFKYFLLKKNDPGPANIEYGEFETRPANFIAPDQNIPSMPLLAAGEEKSGILAERISLILRHKSHNHSNFSQFDGTQCRILTNFSAPKQPVFQEFFPAEINMNSLIPHSDQALLPSPASIFIEKNSVGSDYPPDGLQLIKNVTPAVVDVLVASDSSMKNTLKNHLYDASVNTISAISIDPVSLMIRPCLLFYAYRQARFVDHNMARPVQLALGLSAITTIRHTFFSSPSSPSFASIIFKTTAAAFAIVLKMRGTIH